MSTHVRDASENYLLEQVPGIRPWFSKAANPRQSEAQDPAAKRTGDVARQINVGQRIPGRIGRGRFGISDIEQRTQVGARAQDLNQGFFIDGLTASRVSDGP